MVRPIIGSVRCLVDAVCLTYDGGIGDFLMLSTIARELKIRGVRRVFILTEFADLYLRNPDVDGAAPCGSRLGRLFIKLAGERVLFPTYLINYDWVADKRDPPPEPALAYMCRMAGITGRITLRPYMPLSGAERGLAPPTAAASPSRAAPGARVRVRIRSGSPGGSPRSRPTCSGRTRWSRSAARATPPSPAPTTSAAAPRSGSSPALLAGCRMYVGLEGMPMHMARTIKLPSVIVYGGRLRPDQIGYICNENLYNAVACAPCWQDARCDFGRVCMETITAGAVIAAAERMLAAPRRPRPQVLRDRIETVPEALPRRAAGVSPLSGRPAGGKGSGLTPAARPRDRLLAPGRAHGPRRGRRSPPDSTRSRGEPRDAPRDRYPPKTNGSPSECERRSVTSSGPCAAASGRPAFPTPPRRGSGTT